MQTTIDPAEVAKFEAMATEWWDPQGKFKPLHEKFPFSKKIPKTSALLWK